MNRVNKLCYILMVGTFSAVAGEGVHANDEPKELLVRWKDRFALFLTPSILGYNMWDIKEIEKWPETKALKSSHAPSMNDCLIGFLRSGEPGAEFISVIYCERTKVEVADLLNESGFGDNLWDLPKAVLKKLEAGR